MTDCINEFPADWFVSAKLSPHKKNINLNYYKVDASLPLYHWQIKAGFILKILEDGSNGIVGILWVEGYWKKIIVKSKDGKR